MKKLTILIFFIFSISGHLIAQDENKSEPIFRLCYKYENIGTISSDSLTGSFLLNVKFNIDSTKISQYEILSVNVKNKHNLTPFLEYKKNHELTEIMRDRIGLFKPEIEEIVNQIEIEKVIDCDSVFVGDYIRPFVEIKIN